VLQELDEVAIRILQGRDPHGAVVCGILDELDPGLLQALPIRPDVVARESDHVSRRVAVAAMHLAVRPQRKLSPSDRPMDRGVYRS